MVNALHAIEHRTTSSSALVPRAEAAELHFSGFTAIRVSARRWRVVARTGRVAGYVEHHPEAPRRQFAATRMNATLTGFIELDAFEALGEAVEALGYL